MNVKRYQGQGMDLSDLPKVVQRACVASMHRTVSAYGEDTVDTQMTHDQVRLCEATAEYLYSEYTPLDNRYEKGSRLELEKYVTEAIEGAESQRERALAIMRFVRDMPLMKPSDERVGAKDSFSGGTEEAVIGKHSAMCNEQARVFCVMCQVADVPARYVGHYVGGHGVMEAYFDGGWAYFDNRGKYFLKSDGSFASTWDIICEPTLIDSQSEKVRGEIVEGVDYSTTRIYFSPVEVTVITNYFVWESDRFGFRQLANTDERKARVMEVRKEFPEELSHENVLLMLDGKKDWPR